jgi:hypothetical protein
MNTDRWHPLKSVSFITLASIALWTGLYLVVGVVAHG